ncbi:MAG: nucleoside-diphosphate-sugar epimerase [Oceanicoccus sp.]|jgi:nucleoside-diphosphate-sugar epimerase
MKILIIGSGHVGKALAKRLREKGHTVTSTTTTQEKVANLKKYADEVVVLTGAETDKVIAAAADCDAIVVTVAPNVKNTRTVEERHFHYHETLVKSCTSAAAACDNIVFCSSTSVYGDGGDGDGPITEQTPTANHDEPSSKYYQQAEQEILGNAGGCVLRCPDMYGAPGDIDFPQRVKMAHDYFGGKAIFNGDSPLYCIHFEDVVEVVYHALTKPLSGIYNVCDNDITPYNVKQIFDAICDEKDWDRLEYLDQIKIPNRKISSQKLYDSGYKVYHGDPNAAVVERAQS